MDLYLSQLLIYHGVSWRTFFMNQFQKSEENTPKHWLDVSNRHWFSIDIGILSFNSNLKFNLKTFPWPSLMTERFFLHAFEYANARNANKLMAHFYYFVVFFDVLIPSHAHNSHSTVLNHFSQLLTSNNGTNRPQKYKMNKNKPQAARRGSDKMNKNAK